MEIKHIILAEQYYYCKENHHFPYGKEKAAITQRYYSGNIYKENYINRVDNEIKGFTRAVTYKDNKENSLDKVFLFKGYNPDYNDRTRDIDLIKDIQHEIIEEAWVILLDLITNLCYIEKMVQLTYEKGILKLHKMDF